MNIWIFISIFLFVVLLLGGIILYRAIRQINELEKYVDSVETIALEQRTLIEKLYLHYQNTTSKFKEIDLKGAFEADDEVGFVFNFLKESLYEIGTIYDIKEEKTE